MEFLHEAHRRGVLRQMGAIYFFRHIELQHRWPTWMISWPVSAARIAKSTAARTESWRSGLHFAYPGPDGRAALG